MCKKYFLLMISLLLIISTVGCSSVTTKKIIKDDGTVGEKQDDKELTDKIDVSGDKVLAKHQEYLDGDSKARETFRVLLTSDHYIVSQMKYKSTIARVKDPGGDKYISDEIKKLNKIDEVREGLISLWLYPDSGSIMKVRPQRPTYIVEIDKLLTEDIQRWNFSFPKKFVHPTRFDIKYRVILQKTISDEAIIKEVQDKMRGEM